MGGQERVERQHASGRLTVRERIERLLDPGSFHETGALAGRGDYGEDGEIETSCPPTRSSARGGSTAGGWSSRATTSPSAAARPTPRSGRRRSTRSGWRTTCASRSCGSSTAPGAAAASSRSRTWASRTCRRCRASTWWSSNLAIVPVVAAALGPVAGLGAARVVCSHFSVIVRGSAQLFVAGPPVVAAAMGEAPDKEDARRRAPPGPRRRGGQRSRRTRTTRSRSSGASSPTCRGASGRRRRSWRRTTRRTGARRSCSRSCRATGASPTRCAASSRPCSTADRSSSWARASAAPLITSLARLGGRPVGVLASDPEHYGGGVTADASEKLARFVDMCDQFHLPVVNFVDVPGFVIGTEAERAGHDPARRPRALRRLPGERALGVGARAQGVRRRGRRPRRRLAAEPALRLAVGRLGLAADGGRPRGGLPARARGGRGPGGACGPRSRRASTRCARPFRTAERFSVEEIIDPRDTRPLLCDWAERAHELVAQELHLGPKARGPRP